MTNSVALGEVIYMKIRMTIKELIESILFSKVHLLYDNNKNTKLSEFWGCFVNLAYSGNGVEDHLHGLLVLDGMG